MKNVSRSFKNCTFTKLSKHHLRHFMYENSVFSIIKCFQKKDLDFLKFSIITLEFEDKEELECL